MSWTLMIYTDPSGNLYEMSSARQNEAVAKVIQRCRPNEGIGDETCEKSYSSALTADMRCIIPVKCIMLKTTRHCCYIVM